MRPDKVFITLAGQVQALLQARQAEAQEIAHERARELVGGSGKNVHSSMTQLDHGL